MEFIHFRGNVAETDRLSRSRFPEELLANSPPKNFRRQIWYNKKEVQGRQCLDQLITWFVSYPSKGIKE
jgi:hypothetical protein